MKNAGGCRRVFRILATVLFCLLMYLFGLILKCLPLGHTGRRFRIVCRATRFWGHVLARVWGMRIRVSGPVPHAPFFLVSNHLSYTDILVLCAVCPAWVISKSEVAGWPGIGALTRIGPTIYINREVRRDVKRMNQLIANLVLDGGAVSFFPEGTTSDGEAVLPFKPSLFQPAVEMKLPVTTAAIAYETPSGVPPPREIIAWVGGEDFIPHINRLFCQPGFTAYIRFGSETLQRENRKELAAASYEQVRDILQELQFEIGRQ